MTRKKIIYGFDASRVRRIGRVVNQVEQDPRFPVSPPARPTVTGANSIQCVIKAILDDALECSFTFDTETDEDTFYIAKPWLLRKTPFDGKTRNGFTYTYSGSQSRESNNGSTTENQELIPGYVINDIIYAISTPTDVKIEEEFVTWVDLNVDGRMWAKV